MDKSAGRAHTLAERMGVTQMVRMLSTDELLTLLECARYALSDADSYQDLAEHLDLSDEYLKSLQEKLHKTLGGTWYMDDELIRKIDRRALEIVWGPGFESLSCAAVRGLLETEFGHVNVAERIALLSAGDETADITHHGALDIQVCVPEGWTDERVLEFANRTHPCGTAHGWHVRKAGDPALNGAPERHPCAQRELHVHIMLDA
jgi:hypothetical protein